MYDLSLPHHRDTIIPKSKVIKFCFDPPRFSIMFMLNVVFSAIVDLSLIGSVSCSVTEHCRRTALIELCVEPL